MHTMMAVGLRLPEMAVDQREAKTMAEAIANVARHYDIATAGQKTLDWTNLIMVTGAIYGTRILQIVARTKNERTRIQATAA